MKLFDSFFLKLFLITNFKNTENIILAFFENYFYSMNIILFYIFCVFRKKKKSNMFFVFFLFFLFKNYNQTDYIFPIREAGL